nr:MAG TPA: hypothetical protein [Caudoviricetes sp.]
MVLKIYSVLYLFYVLGHYTTTVFKAKYNFVYILTNF